jgi:hypothetical protein
VTNPIVVYEVQKNKRERVRVALDHFKGHDLIDVRVTVQMDHDGPYMPTGKGVSLKVEKLPELIAALQVAAAEAAERGLLPRQALKTKG